VTGQLGGSLASGWHLDFTPRLKEGQWLANKRLPSAMMDLSDGLAADAARLAKASGCGLQIFPESVPRRSGVSLESAFCDGEDFELLFAVPEARVGEMEHEWRQAFPKLALSAIGNLTTAEEGLHPRELFTKGGYNHFQ
jgi:thiamine-monophosphate kinase